jgi:hypothetical protein
MGNARKLETEMTEKDYEDFAHRMEECFPKMFSGKYGGFAVGAGWWPILESLCANIQSHIDWKNEQKEKYGRGDGCEQVVVEQIKEKFGGLRFYYQGGNDTIDGMVRMAESWASIACEECGGIGTRRSGGWIRTLCDFHIAEREALKKE